MDRTDFRAIVTDPLADRRARETLSNMSEHSDRRADDAAKPPPPTRAQRLAAAGFLGAFGLTILTVLLTGLKVGAPAARHVLLPSPVVGSSAPAPVEKTSPAPTAAQAAPAEPPRTAAESKASDDAPEDAGTDRDDAARKARRKDAENRPSSEAR
jgi:hypothetical protein